MHLIAFGWKEKEDESTKHRLIRQILERHKGDRRVSKEKEASLGSNCHYFGSYHEFCFLFQDKACELRTEVATLRKLESVGKPVFTKKIRELEEKQMKLNNTLRIQRGIHRIKKDCQQILL